MIGELDQLIIGEDTSGHVNDLVWIYDLKSGAMTRVASTPYGSETTSPYWHTLGDYNYMTFVVQHPYGETKNDQPATIAAMKTLSENAPQMVRSYMLVVCKRCELVVYKRCELVVCKRCEGYIYCMRVSQYMHSPCQIHN